MGLVSHGARQGGEVVDVGSEVFAIATQLIAHGLGRLLLVRLAVVPRFLVEITDRWPSPCSRAILGIPDSGLLQIDIAEYNMICVFKLLDDFVPRRSLLYSSPSPGRSNPTNENGFTGVDIRMDEFIKISGCQASTI